MSDKQHNSSELESIRLRIQDLTAELERLKAREQSLSQEFDSEEYENSHLMED
jgi:hypothetical protein